MRQNDVTKTPSEEILKDLTALHEFLSAGNDLHSWPYPVQIRDYRVGSTIDEVEIDHYLDTIGG